MLCRDVAKGRAQLTGAQVLSAEPDALPSCGCQKPWACTCLAGYLVWLSTLVAVLCRYAALSAQINSEEAIDVVLVESYPGNGTMWNNLKQSKYVPFNPTDKYTIGYVTNPADGSTYQLLKGAPQVCTSLVLPCPAALLHLAHGPACRAGLSPLHHW